ncbi:MAG: hypothetical protein GEU95_01010 [Rhizobiales bacterium]|nr:hypothetical protein [Hyphomicrobiales bacterium]
MTKPRRDFNLTEKLAAMTLKWLHAIGQGIPYEHAKAMSAEQINSLIEWDHYPIRYVDGGTTHPTNGEPRFRQEHREKTAKVDQPQIAKGDRIRADQEEFRRRLLTKLRGDIGRHEKQRPKRKIPSRSFAQQRGQR